MCDSDALKRVRESLERIEKEEREFVESLTVEELRAVAMAFWHWGDFENGCPKHRHPEYPCGRRDGGECDGYGDSQLGCWVKYYAWTAGQRTEGGRGEMSEEKTGERPVCIIGQAVFRTAMSLDDFRDACLSVPSTEMSFSVYNDVLGGYLVTTTLDIDRKRKTEDVESEWKQIVEELEKRIGKAVRTDFLTFTREDYDNALRNNTRSER